MAIEDILIAPVRVLYAPLSSALPADDLAYGGAWPGAWEEVGYTNAPLTWNHSLEEYEAKAQQRLGPLKRVRIDEALALETTLVELTGDNLQLAIGGTVTETAPGASQVGKTELEAGGQYLLDERMWGFEGWRVYSGVKYPVRLFVWKATSTLNGALEFAKEKETGIALQVKALVDTSKVIGKDLFELEIVTAPATG